MAFDLYQEITNRIIAEMEKGSIPWNKPWLSVGGCISHVTGKPYSLLNQLMLEKPGEYITFKQALEEGGHVKKGEKSKPVVFWKILDKKDESGNVVIDPDTGEVEKVYFLRYYSVFHIDQCEGITPRWNKPLPQNTLQPDQQAEQIIADYVQRSGVRFKPQLSNQAYYAPALDLVVVPELKQYKYPSEYYSTAFHELTHSTGHHSRLNRINDIAAFGTETYSKEELVAELGSVFLCHSCGLESIGTFRNSTAYLQGWLHHLRDDKKLIVSAATKAEKAVKLILGPNAVTAEEESV